jgi:hypothetical protein
VELDTSNEEDMHGERRGTVWWRRIQIGCRRKTLERRVSFDKSVLGTFEVGAMI